MEWLQRMNSAISYIEDNITAEIDFDKVAQKAMCSSYHFQRMFSFITGVPMSEYIRRRRLTLAAFELQNSSVKIIELALKYGYDSPNSFTRAFQNLHGVTPKSARDKGVQLKAYPHMSLHISIKGDVEMKYRVEEKEAFSLFGVDTLVNAVDEKYFQQVPEFWNTLVNDGTMEKILRAAGNSTEITIKGDMFGNHEMLINGATYGHNSKDGTFRYLICQNTPKSGVSDEFVTLDIPSLTWAVFPTDKITEEEITEKMQTIWRRIYSEWFPTSSYEHADAPELEMFEYVENGKFVAEVWIPIIKK